MTTTSDIVAQYFAANPTASTSDVAKAVQSNGGLTSDMSQALAQHYGTDVGTIGSNYNSLTGAPPLTAASVLNGISSGNISQAQAPSYAKQVALGGLPAPTPTPTPVSPAMSQFESMVGKGNLVTPTPSPTPTPTPTPAPALSLNDQIASTAKSILDSGGTYADVASAMDKNHISPSQLATALNINQDYVQQQYNIASPTPLSLIHI